MKHVFARFGRVLAIKGNFMRYSLVAIGLPGFGYVTWLYFADYPDATILLWLYMVGAVGGVAYLWGLLMWKFFMEDRSRRILGQKHDAP